MTPIEAQDAACLVLKQTGYNLSRKDCYKGPSGVVFVFEIWEGQNFRRVLVGPQFVTVTRRFACRKATYQSYPTADYARFAKYAKAGELHAT